MNQTRDGLIARLAGRGLGRFASAHPMAVIELAGALGRAAGPVHGPSRDEIRALFGNLPQARVAWIAQEMRSMEFRHHAFRLLARLAGVEPFASLVRCDQANRLRRLHADGHPTILVTCHIGEFLWIPTALYGLKVPVLIIGKTPPGISAPEGIEIVWTHGDPKRGPIVFKRALERLQAGGIVLIAIDGNQGTGGIDVQFLGRRISLRRGTGMLAQLTAAAVVPVLARWEPWRGCVLNVHEPLSPLHGDGARARRFEHALLIEAARCFEEYARARPQELRLRFLRRFLAAPRVERTPFQETAPPENGATGGLSESPIDSEVVKQRVPASG